MGLTTPFKARQSSSDGTVSVIMGGEAMPVSAGRQSMPEGAPLLSTFIEEMSLVTPDFQTQLLAGLEYLATYYPDISYAVDNIVQLGNTPFKLYFDNTKVTDAKAKKLLSRVKERSKNWYQGGMNSLINDLLAQCAINGALSMEGVPNNNLDGVRKVVLVACKSVRFQYSSKDDDYLPLQLPSNGFFIPTDSPLGVKLNPATYTYLAYRRFTEKPYGVPPFLSALYNISIDKDMMANLKFVIKKLGILGFLEVLVNGPRPKQNEDEEAYKKRTKKYLDSVVPEIEKGLSKGYVAGFKDLHEFKMHNTTSNVAGAKELVELNDIKMMAGLKQDPLMFGRNFNTTETLGRVVMSKMISQVGNYQQLVASALERVILLDLQLSGEDIRTIDMVFDPPMVGDRLREEQAFNTRIKSMEMLYNAGVIDQDQRAHELGFDEASQKKPRVETINGKPTAEPATKNGNPAAGSTKEDVTA